MYTCPHCGQEGITFLGKLFLKPDPPARCAHCDRPIGVRDLDVLLSLVPLALGLAGAAWIRGVWPGLLSVATGFLVYCYYYSRHVPLVSKA